MRRHGVRSERALSLWARTQTERLHTRRWTTRIELSSELFDWIELFNDARLGLRANEFIPSPFTKDQIWDSPGRISL
jgi:hypothetical protein